MPTSTSRAQVVTQPAAKACPQQSHRRSSTIPRITPHWSGCGVLMGSTCAEQAQCAEVKVSTLVPNSPAVHHSTSPDTSQQLAAATSIRIDLVRCRLSRPHQVSCPLQPPPRNRFTRSTQAADHQDQGESCRGFGHIRLRCAIWRFYLLVSGFRRPRALHGHWPRASAGRCGRRHFGGSDRAQLRQVSCQRTACASSPLLNPSCTQAIAEVRPFAGRSRHRCAGKRPLHLLRCRIHARRLTRLADGLF
jgi:hypothetical protein